MLITDFSVVDAVAASPFTVFAATRRGLLLYDRRARRWRLPVTGLEGYPPARVRVALADPGDDAVWLGLADGYARYDAGTRRWDRAFLAGGVTDVVLDADDPVQGVWVRAGGRWVQVSRFGPAPPGGAFPLPQRQIRPIEVEGALRQAPLADALRAVLLTDPRLRMHQFTSAARSSDQPELFFGTNGMGLIRLDPTTGEWEPLPFGLRGARAGALAPAPEGAAWVAAGGRVGEPGGITWIAEDLATTSQGDASTRATAGVEFLEARDLVASGTALWLATDRGLYRVEAGSLRGQRVELVDDVSALAAAPDGVWAGTRHGVMRVTSDSAAAALATPPVLSLARVRDSVWVGTTEGLLVIPGADDGEAAAPERAPDRSALPGGLRGPIIALTQAADTLVAATPDQLAWRRPGTGEWTLLRPGADLGRIAVLAPDPDGVWVGGATGLAHWTVGTARFVTLRVPADVPAAVRDVAVSGRYVWVATDEGAVRFDRSAALRR